MKLSRDLGCNAIGMLMTHSFISLYHQIPKEQWISEPLSGKEQGMEEGNKLKLNPDKIEVLLVRSNLILGSGTTAMLDGSHSLPLKGCIHSLESLLDLALLLDVQVMVVVARSVYYKFRLVCQLCPFLSQKELAMVIHALVISKLNYFNMFNMGLP